MTRCYGMSHYSKVQASNLVNLRASAGCSIVVATWFMTPMRTPLVEQLAIVRTHPWMAAKMACYALVEDWGARELANDASDPLEYFSADLLRHLLSLRKRGCHEEQDAVLCEQLPDLVSESCLVHVLGMSQKGLVIYIDLIPDHLPGVLVSEPLKR